MLACVLAAALCLPGCERASLVQGYTEGDPGQTPDTVAEGDAGNMPAPPEPMTETSLDPITMDDATPPAGPGATPPEPTSPPSPPPAQCNAAPVSGGTTANVVLITGTSVDGGQVATVSPGAEVRLSFNYTAGPCITQSGSFSLTHQIVAGFDDGSAPTCVESMNCLPASGSVDAVVTAPSTPGTYHVLVQNTQHSQCDDRWEGSPPGSDARIAVVCVQ